MPRTESLLKYDAAGFSIIFSCTIAQWISFVSCYFCSGHCETGSAFTIGSMTITRIASRAKRIPCYGLAAPARHWHLWVWCHPQNHHIHPLFGKFTVVPITGSEKGWNIGDTCLYKFPEPWHWIKSCIKKWCPGWSSLLVVWVIDCDKVTSDKPRNDWVQ